MRRTALMFVLAGLVGALVAVPIAVYASHQFTDVPSTNPFHADIDWLANTGVTKGCGGSNYCPKDNVTREQMAAFMHRLGTNQVVDAGKLEGYTAADIGPRAVFNLRDPLGYKGLEEFGFGEVINVPAAGGVLLFSGGVDAVNFGSDDVISCEFWFDGVPVKGTKRLSRVDGANGVNTEENCQTSGALSGVTAGAYGVVLRIESATGDTEFRNLSFWALWVPFSG
jgi:hypothetical protein